MINNRWMVRTGVLALAMIAAPAFSATPSQFKDVSVKVSYADLDIHSEAGAKVLYSRLKRASKQACNYESYPQSGLGEVRKAKACYRDALDEAVAGIDSKSLHDIHSG